MIFIVFYKQTTKRWGTFVAVCAHPLRGVSLPYRIFFPFLSPGSNFHFFIAEAQPGGQIALSFWHHGRWRTKHSGGLPLTINSTHEVWYKKADLRRSTDFLFSLTLHQILLDKINVTPLVYRVTNCTDRHLVIFLKLFIDQKCRMFIFLCSVSDYMAKNFVEAVAPYLSSTLH